MKQYYFNEKNFINHYPPKNISKFHELVIYFKYSVISVRTFILIYLKKLTSNNIINYKYEISICAIFKNESRFIKEWIELHLIIGIDHFYLYNNNSTDNYLDILKPYIDKGVIDLIEFPGNYKQMEAYEDCYIKRQNETHWIAFIDIDEFLCPINISLKEFLKSFNYFPNIAIYWKMFGTNDIKIHDYSKNVVQQYTRCWPKLSTHTKMICNMNFVINEFYSPHQFKSKIYGISIPPINQFKKLIYNLNRVSKYRNYSIQLNHYWSKAEDTFLKRLENGYAIYRYNYNIEDKINIFTSHESFCTSNDYNILKFLK